LKKILLVGSSGQLGVDINNTLKDFDVDGITSKDFDFSKSENLHDALANKKYDFVINSMAMTNTSLCESERELALKLNHEAVKQIVTYCKSIDAVLIHFSTDYVFDGKLERAYIESDDTNPLSVYGESKLLGDRAALDYEKSFVFRVSSIYGSSLKSSNFVNTMIEKSEQLSELNVVDDQFMSPTHTLDVAKMVKYFIQNDITDFGLYHCSGEGKCSWADFTIEIMKLTNNPVKIKKVSYKDFESLVERPVNSELSNNKISRYFTMPKWNESLIEYLDIKKKQKEIT
jgi:dTDP-4-dehydrorhamnose reductase